MNVLLSIVASLEAAGKSVKERQALGLKGHNFYMKENLRF